MTKPRAILRVCVRCAKWLAVGLVITVAVSWGLAAWMPHRGWGLQMIIPNVHDSGRNSLSVDQYTSFGCERRAWQYEAQPPNMIVDSFSHFGLAIDVDLQKLKSADTKSDAAALGWPD